MKLSTIIWSLAILPILLSNASFSEMGSDPINWVLSNAMPPLSIGCWNDVAYGNGIFVVTNICDGSFAVSSNNGQTWTTSNTSVSQYIAGWSQITFGNGVFFTVAGRTLNGKAYSAVSSNGITWQIGTFPNNLENWEIVGGGNGIFICTDWAITSTDANIAAISSDGIHWNATTLPSSDRWSSLAFGNGTFVLVGESQSTLASQDGIHWTIGTPPTAGLGVVTYGNGIFVAICGFTCTIPVVYSSDGINWQPSNYTLSEGATDITFGDGVFVIVGIELNNTLGAVSSDGINWQATNLPSAQNWITVGYGNGTFVALAVRSFSVAIGTLAGEKKNSY